MSTNGVNVSEDADMSECDGEKVVTMMDVLQEQEDFEEDANAVLGASDDKNCTYPKGYIKRQAIYACMTCCSEAKDDPDKRAGVCLACSLTCHENHELVELYLKRNFCCDCGNPKFNSHPCQFTPDKTDLNEENNYNQNFSGVYCVCHRPYPDPDSEVEEEMIQCIVCEDWLHSSHLEATVPAADQYAEMICKGCMEKNEFLHDYSSFAVNIENVDVVNLNGAGDVTSVYNGDTEADENNEKSDVPQKVDDVNMKEPIEDYVKPNVTKDDEEQSVQDKQNSEQEETRDLENENEDTVPSASSEPNQIAGDASCEKTEQISENTNDATNKLPTEVENNKVANEADTVKSQENDVKETSEIKPNNDTNTAEDAEKLEEERLLADPDEENSKPIEVENTSVEKTQNNEQSTDTEKSKCDPAMETIESSENVKSKESRQVESETAPSDNSEAVSEENAEILASEKKLENEENKESSDAAPSTESKSEIVPESENNEGSDVNMSETNSETLPAEKKDDEIEAETQESEKEINKAQEENVKDTEMADGTVNTIEGEQSRTESSNKVDDNEVKTDSEETSNVEENANDNKRKLEDDIKEDIIVKKPKLDDVNSCTRPRGVQKVYHGATFWPSNFRQKLCTCSECLSMYKDLSVLFLTDLEDTVTAYEALGKINGKPASQYEKGLQALSSLDRVQQINALTEYNKMRDKLLDFLKSFKDRKEIVKEEDIKAFFAKMKPKREPDGVYFCR